MKIRSNKLLREDIIEKEKEISFLIGLLNDDQLEKFTDWLGE